MSEKPFTWQVKVTGTRLHGRIEWIGNVKAVRVVDAVHAAAANSGATEIEEVRAIKKEGWI